MKNDWRYTNQERYLHDKIFSLRKYDIPYPEHSHCEFCWIKFGAGGECQEGYTDENEDYWICPQCFEDFKELLFGEWHCSTFKIVAELGATILTSSFFKNSLVHCECRYENKFVRGKSHVNGIENFWSFAKRRLAKFNGCNSDAFVLHLKEYEWRYNHRHED